MNDVDLGMVKLGPQSRSSRSMARSDRNKIWGRSRSLIGSSRSIHGSSGATCLRSYNIYAWIDLVAGDRESPRRGSVRDVPAVLRKCIYGALYRVTSSNPPSSSSADGLGGACAFGQSSPSLESSSFVACSLSSAFSVASLALLS